MSEIKNCCGNCIGYGKISKQYGLCLGTNYEIKNVNTGKINNVYVRVGKYNICKNHKLNNKTT